MATRKKSSSDSVRNIVRQEFNSLQRDLKNELKDQISESLNSFFGAGSSIGDALGAGLGEVASGVVSGNGIDARSVSYAVARSFTPEIKDFFNQSTSQSGGDLLDLISAAQRNF